MVEFISTECAITGVLEGFAFSGAALAGVTIDAATAVVMAAVMPTRVSGELGLISR